MDYSIVVPLHNEEGNVTALYARVKQVMEQMGGSFEFVLVDDGSTDRTYHLLKEIATVDKRVLVVRLRRKFGETPALAAGFDHASGEFILVMEGDLQHDPNDIPRFLKKLEEGYDIVSGWRKDRTGNLRRIPSRCANWLMARLCGVDIHDFGTTLKAYRREVIKSVPLYGEMHHFIPALASWYGASICEIPIRNVNRGHGKSPYGVGRTFRVFFDLLTIRFLLRYKSRPLHFFGALGALSITAGGIPPAILFAMTAFSPQPGILSLHGPILVIGAVLILSGFQLLFIGLLGELQVRHYYSRERRTPYTIDRLVHQTSPEEKGTLSAEHDAG